MKNKKLVRNVPAILAVVMMTTVMVLSSCGNTFDSEHANITIRLNGSGSGRAISDAEKSAATFNVYFNDSLVASNVSGTYNGTAVVGTTLKIRLDALVNGKRIARGEDTITVQAGTNNVTIKLTENREQSSGELKGVPQVGSIIMSDGSLRTSANIGSDTADAIAVVYKVAGGKAWAVGKVHDGSVWCRSNAEGLNKVIDGLVTEMVNTTAGQLTFKSDTYIDGSTGLSILQSAVNDYSANNYPAWYWATSYGVTQSLIGNFATGWYLPTLSELFDIWREKDTVNSSLTVANGDTFGSNGFCSSSQYASPANEAYVLDFDNGDWNTYVSSKDNVNNVCAVRQFTY